MNQEQNNLNPNNFNTQGNNGIPNNQPLNNQSFNQGMGFNQQPINPQPQPTPSYEQPIMQEPTPQPMNNTFESGNANNQSFNSKPPKKTNLGLIIGIIAVLAIIGVGIIFGSKLLSNGGNNSNNNSTPNTNENNNIGNNNANENKIDYKTWGVADHFAAESDGPAESFYINFPNYGGTSHGYALIADQANDTAALISGQNDYAPKINGISELFPAYFEQLEYTLQKRYGLRASKFKLTLTDNSPVVIGNYDMHTFTGNIAFDYEGTSKNYKFVAYATTLKSNGAYAYWLVYDTSDNQSNEKLIKEHAYNMAQTFREKN